MMRIKDEYDWSEKTYSFGEACRKHICEVDRGGQIEELETQVENLQNAVVRLLHIVNERAEFNSSEVEYLLGTRYKAIHLEEM